jgi:hypothetical protein
MQRPIFWKKGGDPVHEPGTVRIRSVVRLGRNDLEVAQILDLAPGHGHVAEDVASASESSTAG